jgi:hypothetical protein
MAIDQLEREEALPDEVSRSVQVFQHEVQDLGALHQPGLDAGP